MIWLAIVSLAAGALLAQRFKIIVLAPATSVLAAVAVGSVQTNGVWSTLLIMAIASVGIQIGYFLGMLIQYSLDAFSARKPSGFSDTQTAQNHSISRTSISQ